LNFDLHDGNGRRCTLPATLGGGAAGENPVETRLLFGTLRQGHGQLVPAIDRFEEHPVMSTPMLSTFRRWGFAVLLAATWWTVQAQTASRNLAPGFTALPKDAKVAIAPLDVELFEVSAGGVLVPKADWTEAANTHMGTSLRRKVAALGVATEFIDDKVADEHAEVLHLYGAVARAISLHHMGPLKLPTKADRLDWSFGDAFRPLGEATGARYGLFTWMRDSYASAERKAMMVGLALLGIGVAGGVQVGYASLVDLETGQVLWFNQAASVSGDLRDEKSAAASVDSLLTGFPGTAEPRK
jgi:hypothetical protein